MTVGSLEKFLARARRRYIAHAASEQFSLAACIAAGGFLLLLLLGTQVLDWYWPVLLLVISLGIGLWRLRPRIPSLYVLAQRIDHRLGLHDTLSTAYYFRNYEAGSVAEWQYQQADQVAATAPLEHAIPYRFPRSGFVLAGLCVVAATLFATRYFVRHTLSLSAPIADVHFTSFFEPAPVQHAEKRKSAIQEQFEQQMKQMGLALDQVDDHPGMELPPEAPNQTIATPDGRAPISSNEKGGPENGKPDTQGSEPGGDEGSKSTGANEPKESAAADALPGLNVNGGKQQNSPNNLNTSTPGKTGENSNSMLDKMRDAMNNLMAKLKMPGGNQPSQQPGNQNTPNGNSQQAQGQKAGGPQNKSNGQGQKTGQPSGEQGSEGNPSEMAGAGKSNEMNGNQPGGQDSKSGQGKQEGDKSIQDAEQLAAMGKISEIIGKRSQQLQGEMSVEVPSGKQQLKSAYTNRRSLHGDAGSELTREQIPLMLQPYVQRYFDEIRKTQHTRTDTKSRS